MFPFFETQMDRKKFFQLKRPVPDCHPELGEGRLPTPDLCISSPNPYTPVSQTPDLRSMTLLSYPQYHLLTMFRYLRLILFFHLHRPRPLLPRGAMDSSPRIHRS